MNCKDCGAIVKNEDTICPSCGAELSKDNNEVLGGTASAEVEDSVTKEDGNYIEPGSNEDSVENVSDDPEFSNNEETETSYEDQLDMKPAKKKTGLIVALSGIALIVVVLAAYIGFFGGYDTITSTLGIGSRHPLTYIKDNEFYIKNGSNKAEKISEKIFKDETMLQWVVDESQYKNYAMIIKQRKSGKLLYFFDNIAQGNDFSGNLNLYKMGEKTQKIAQGVYLGLAVSKDGGQILFLQNYKQDKGYGDLYIYNEDGKKEKLGSGVRVNSYKLSNDGKTIAYVENSDKSEDKWDLSIKVNGGQKEKIDTGLINLIDVGNNGSTIVYVKPNGKTEGSYDLYVKENGKATKCIANNIADLSLDRKHGSLFVLSDYNAEKKSGDLYFKEFNKDKVKVDDSVIGILKLGDDKFEPEMQFTGNENSDVLYVKNFDQEKSNGDLYIKQKNNSKPVKVASGIALSNLQFSEDLKTIAYYRVDEASGDMKLFTANEAEDNTTFKEKSISDKLSNYGNLSKKGNLIVYSKKSSDGSKEELYEMKGDTAGIKISSSAFGSAKVSKDGKAVIFEEENNGAYSLFLKKPGKEKVTVSTGLTQSDKSYTYDFKKIYYTKNMDAASFKGDLYEKETGKSLVKIDGGVTMVLFSE